MPSAIPLILILASAYSLLFVVALGLVVHAALRKIGLVRDDDPFVAILSAIASGCLWAAVTFLLLYKLEWFRTPFLATSATLALDIGLCAVVLAVFRPFDELRRIVRGFARPGFLALAGLSLTAGAWAFLQFPHTLDSGQLLWTQEVLWGRTGPADSMIGFSGLIAPLGGLLPDIPLVTVAAGFKPLLMALAFFTCAHAVTALGLVHRVASTALLAVLMIVSVFGLYGVVELGKDSIYGILLSVAFMVTLCRPDVETRGAEAALYFAAAAVTGIVTVPYMLIALGLWLLFAATAAQSRAVLFCLLAANAVTLPVAVAGMIKKPYWLLLAAYAVAALLVPMVLWLVGRFGAPLAGLRRTAVRLLPFLPLLCLAAAAALLPAGVDIPVWVNADGTMVTEVRAPLDGKTDFLGLMFAHDFQSVTIGLGLAALLLMGISRRVTPAMIAVACMPLAAVAVILLHFHLGLRFLSAFNQWDLVKDVPLWYGGALFSVFAVAGLGYAWERFVPRFMGLAAGHTAYTAVAALLAAVVLYVALPRMPVARYTAPVAYTPVGGSVAVDMALASEGVWRHLRHANLFVHQDVLPDFFYSFQMYGARPSEYRDGVLSDALAELGRVGFLVPQEEVFALKQFALKRRARLVHLAALPRGKAALLAMSFDGSGEIELPDSPELHGLVASVRGGAHGLETFGDRTFRWFRKEAALAVAMADGVACVTVAAFGGQDGLALSVQAEGEATAPVLDVSGGTLERPKKVSFTIRSNAALARVRLVATTAESQFPGDPRPIAWGGFMPVTVAPGTACPVGGMLN